MKIAIFLGAGASKSEGAPLQADIFKRYFDPQKILRIKNDLKKHNHDAELSSFFNQFFGIDLSKNNKDIKFPTFEEVIGVLDLADFRHESFKKLTRQYSHLDIDKIGHLREKFVFLITDVLFHSLAKSNGKTHNLLIENLEKLILVRNISFFTTNYDLLCDNALTRRYTDEIDYGIDFVNDVENSLIQHNKRRIKLFKLHGSLNWLYCPVCNSVKITKFQKTAYKIMLKKDKPVCDICNSHFSPLIVPPTYFKDYSKNFINQVWMKGETELLNVNHLIFCGYSFPDADLHVKYLIKRAQINRRDSKSLKISVINNHSGKCDELRKAEKERYVRFLGDEVEYTNYSFEEFSKDPTIVINN